MAAALTLVATQAPAVTSIKNTKHDLSSGNTTSYSSSNYDEICVFCHTPHKAVSQDNAPLWNRSGTGDITIATYYNSTTLESGVSNPASVADNVLASDAPLCLSCHDGSSLTNELQNPSNLANPADPLEQPNNTNNISGFANLDDGFTASAGVDLHDDHPIGMVYADVVTGDDSAEWHADPGLNFYNGIMWCSSCHDVHDNTYAPFLAADNAGSGLCLKCHDK